MKKKLRNFWKDCVNVNLKEIYLKLSDEFHLNTNEHFGGIYMSNLPDDQNSFARFDNYVMAYGEDAFREPYINVAQSISCKRKTMIYYTNYLKISGYKVDDNTEKVIRRYLDDIQRKHDKILKQLKANYEQKRLEKLNEDF